eukprot:TRINITY_DN59577_c0_g1_i1.p1 TRINITY_DN59577_c0_g1~~TRINITY_DN59577_c0_g1_i1.p1  ORF type:complete len:289 (-),score=23.53 TRINITY_DN59577_c0_g1_i1:279-1145(-)
MNWALHLVGLMCVGTTLATVTSKICGGELFTYPKVPGASKSQCAYIGGYKNAKKTYGYNPIMYLGGSDPFCYPNKPNVFGKGKNGSLAFPPNCGAIKLYSNDNCTGTPTATVSVNQCVTLDNIAFYWGRAFNGQPRLCGAKLVAVQGNACPRNDTPTFVVDHGARDMCIQGGPVDVQFHQKQGAPTLAQCQNVTLWPKDSKCVGNGSITLVGDGKALAENCGGGWYLRETTYTEYDGGGGKQFPCGCPNEPPPPSSGTPTPSGSNKNYPTALASVLLCVIIAVSSCSL